MLSDGELLQVFGRLSPSPVMYGKGFMLVRFGCSWLCSPSLIQLFSRPGECGVTAVSRCLLHVIPLFVSKDNDRGYMDVCACGCGYIDRVA